MKSAADNQATKHGISNLLMSDPRLPTNQSMSSRETHNPCTWHLKFEVWLRNCSVLAEFKPWSRLRKYLQHFILYFLLPTSSLMLTKYSCVVFFFRLSDNYLEINLDLPRLPFNATVFVEAELQPVGFGTGSYSRQDRLSVKASFLAVNLKCKLRSTDQTTHWVRTQWC